MGSLFSKNDTFAQATAPPAREGFCCEARFRAEQQKGWADKFSLPFSPKKFLPEKRIVGSEISHFRAMIFLLFVYLLEKIFEVVSNTSGRRFLDSTARSKTSVISFSIQNGISFLNPAFHFWKPTGELGLRWTPDFLYPTPFRERKVFDFSHAL